jgi:hypothetical protein
VASADRRGPKVERGERNGRDESEKAFDLLAVVEVIDDERITV